MRAQPQEFLPRARTDGMVIKEVDNEVLVYDLNRDKAHCLNSAAAAIWRLCDGKRTLQELARLLGKQSNSQVDERFIWSGLEGLRRSHLLEESGMAWPDEVIAGKGSRMSRREAIRRIGVGAAISLPLVISISAPAVEAAASCDARCKPCSSGSECCSGVCTTSVSGCDGGVNTRRCA
jgi:hypothetical protein